MAAKNTIIKERSRVRHVSFLPDEEAQTALRPKLIGKARPVSAQDTAGAEPSETDLLLHEVHGLVAQLREVVGRPRLDL